MTPEWKIYNLMKDGRPRLSEEIADRIGMTLPAVSALMRRGIVSGLFTSETVSGGLVAFTLAESESAS